MAFTKRAAEIFRDFTSAINPLSGPWQPPKSDIRTLLGEIEDAIDAFGAGTGYDPSVIADLRTRLNDEITRASGREDDLAGLIGKVSPPLTFAGSRSIISDPTNLFGRGPGVFLPRGFALQQGDQIFNGVGGDSDPVVVDYVGVGVDPTKLTTIYADLDASPVYQTVVYPNPVPSDRPDKVHVLAAVFNGQVASLLPVVAADGGAGGASRIVPISPVVVEQSRFDGTFLLIPAFFYIGAGITNGYASYAPPGPIGGTHFPVTLPSDPATDWRVYFDRQKTDPTNPFTVATADASPLYGGARHLLIAQSIGGTVTAGLGITVIGGPLGGLARNQCRMSLDATRATDFFGTTTIDTITDPALLAFGFVNGARDVTNKRPYYGCDVPDPIPAGSMFVRFSVQTDTAGDFGAPTVFLIDEDTGASIATTVVMQREFLRSTTAASYIGRANLPIDLPKNLVLRVGCENPNARDLRVTGLQFAVTRERMGWIARDDLDSDANLSGALSRAPRILSESAPEGVVVGPDIYLIQGQRLPLRLTNCLARRTEGFALAATVTSLPAAPGGNMLTIAGDASLMIEADRVGPTGLLSLRGRSGTINIRAQVPLRFWVSPSSGYTSSPINLGIGDSLTNRRILAFLQAKLQAMGMTPTFIGTIPGQGFGNADDGPLGEGREGWQWADYIHQATRYDPVTPGAESAYLGQAKASKFLYNPFIRAAVSGDPPSRVFNGYIFDFGFYLARFGFAVPNNVAVTLSQNDESLAGSPALATQQVLNGLNTMIPSIRAAGANIRIGIGLHTRPRGTGPDIAFSAYRYPNLQAITAYVQASGDPNLSVLPFWQHMVEEAPWTMETVSGPNPYGMTRTHILDPIHFGDEQRHVVAEVIRGWIAKGETGGTAYAPRYAINGQDFSA